MGKQMVALCDSNASFGERLADYLEHQVAFPYSVMVFTDYRELMKYRQQKLCSDQALRYLILSEDIYENHRKDKSDDSVMCIYVLSEENRDMVEEQRIRYIYRFQSAAMIMHSMLSSMSDEMNTGRRITNIIGAFSPVGGCGQTSFLITLGQYLSKSARTLYLNLEGFSGFRELLGRSLRPDIADVMYQLRRENTQFHRQLEQTVNQIGSLEYIPPVENYPDLTRIKPMEWNDLFSRLRRDGRYEYVLVDISEYVQGIGEVAGGLDQLYAITAEGSVGKAKMNELDEQLRRMGYEQILEQKKTLSIPRMRLENVSLDALIYSELGNYVQKIAGKELGFGTQNVEIGTEGNGS